jgi:hypothetical protein
MRYLYFALGLVFFLSACEAPTSPRINPSVDEGRDPYTPSAEDPVACVKKGQPTSTAAAQSGFAAIRIPGCDTEPVEDPGPQE